MCSHHGEGEREGGRGGGRTRLGRRLPHIEIIALMWERPIEVTKRVLAIKFYPADDMMLCPNSLPALPAYLSNTAYFMPTG